MRTIVIGNVDRIEDFLSALDAIIEQQKTQGEALREIRKGLLETAKDLLKR